MKIQNLVIALAAPVFAAGALTACGGDVDAGTGKAAAAAVAPVDAQDLAKRAIKNFGGLKAYRMAGSVDDGEHGRSDVDLSVSRAGNFHGTVGMEGQWIEVAKTDGDYYVKADDISLADMLKEEGAPAKAVETMVPILSGKYLVVGKKDAPRDVFEGLDVMAGFSSEWNGPAEKGDVVTGEGERLVPLHVTDRDGRPVTMFVTTDDEPRIAKISLDEDGGSGTLTLTGLPDGVAFVPPADQTIDRAQALAAAQGK